MNIEVIVC